MRLLFVVSVICGNFVKLIPDKLMKHCLLLSLLALVMLNIHAQVPQFSSKSYEDWVYTNPAIELNQANILNNRIVLYTTSQGLHLTLTSPAFACLAGHIIDMNVTWITDQWQSDGFNVSKVALTATLLDEGGMPIDSVTFRPVSVSRTNYIDMSIRVPKTMSSARLRFASWRGDVSSNGAVRQIVMTSSLFGDVNLDGEVSVADVNAVLDLILAGSDDQELLKRADVNRDGEVSVADVNAIIDIIVRA